ncbi:MAG: hypothetical protein JSS22_00525 [Proteobacteria bacterium]|nr:hypothetical protein [Pseudomonadota bacterium]
MEARVVCLRNRLCRTICGLVHARAHESVCFGGREGPIDFEGVERAGEGDGTRLSSRGIATPAHQIDGGVVEARSKREALFSAPVSVNPHFDCADCAKAGFEVVEIRQRYCAYAAQQAGFPQACGNLRFRHDAVRRKNHRDGDIRGAIVQHSIVNYLDTASLPPVTI